MLKQLMTAVRITLVLSVLTGCLYPGAVTGICQLLFHDAANGSLITRDGRIVGSGLIGQSFSLPKYFPPRPSAAGPGGYDASASGGSNLGPISKALMDRVTVDAAKFHAENPKYAGSIPVDIVTASGSGLDPHISPAAARAQVARIAVERNISEEGLLRLIDQNTEAPSLGILGESRVNVLRLNLALDDSTARQSANRE
jgi:potassium-transporting ATPase KdpC subunit